MKKSILISVVLAGTLILNGCHSSSDPVNIIDNLGDSQGDGQGNGDGEGNADNGNIKIGSTSVNSTQGGTVVNSNNNNLVVMPAHLNACNGVNTSSAPNVVCGPKSGITYILQSNFGYLGDARFGNGDLDNNAATHDGGALVFDALTEFNGIQSLSPIEANQVENRIQEIYIPSNYIVLSDTAQNDTTVQKYEYMREYFANGFNLKHYMSEDANNPYFDDNNTATPLNNGKTKGSFVATYVMHFTRGVGEATLLDQFKTDTTNLEYLTVSFWLDIERVNATTGELDFSSPAGSPVVFRAKKAGQSSGLVINTTNINLNNILNVIPGGPVGNYLPINVADYFDVVIKKGEDIAVADFAKDILVENALNPWPVKIYATLHEIDSTLSVVNNNNGIFQRSFVRNPAKLDASLFGLDLTDNPYAGAYSLTGGNTNQAYKFNIVYPGGVYNEL